MKAAYQRWIARYLARFTRPEATLGRCHEAAHELARAFPELRVVRGHVHCGWGKRGHWWTVTPDGEIVDPTAAQFTCGIDAYEEYRPGDDVRIGVCANCGDELWGPPGTTAPTVCGSACQDAYVAYLNAGGF